MQPNAFITEYVDPAIALWQDDTNSTLRAMCVISQLDILAEVVFVHLAAEGRPPAGSPGAYRQALAETAPAIGIASDAHDAHKHGWLKNRERQFANGVMQIRTAGTAFFAGHSFADVDFLGETDTSFRLKDGTLVSVAEVIRDVRAAWMRELDARGLPPWGSDAAVPHGV